MKKLRKLNKARQQAHLARNAENRAKASADALRIERDKLKSLNSGLYFSLLAVMDYIEEPPDRNCQCAIAPPCNDCVEYSHLREVLADARAVISGVEKLGA